ncbi:MAG: hypothetical protein MJ237_01595 [bacterium]|nr:hypothetical protein [bacterium]
MINRIWPTDMLINDYYHKVVPKVVKKLPLTQFEEAVSNAIKAARSGDLRGYQTANELVGRLKAGLYLSS